MTPSGTMTRDEAAALLTPEEIARLYRERVVRDKSYQLTPLGAEVASYLRLKKKRLTKTSELAYESSLDKFARHFPDLILSDFEPPVGTERVEEFLDSQWGSLSPRTYNKNLSILTDFFKWAILRGHLHGDPTMAVERARARDVHREVYNKDQTLAIIASQASRRDRLAVRLLLNYGLRKGALRAVQFKHFDHAQQRLTIFSKGGNVQTLPIPDQSFWHDLERLILDIGAEPEHYLMARRKYIPKKGVREFPKASMGNHGMHDWWYACLVNAGIVSEETTKGERMHKARHTAGQRILDVSGNLKATQKLLGHKTIRTTADHYTDWDLDQLAGTLADALKAGEE